MRKSMRIAHVSTFPPQRCGIASFAADIVAAVPDLRHELFALHYGGRPVSARVVHDANVHSLDELIRLAKVISASDCDVVSLQHEFGIWGGQEGEHIHAFLDNLRKPVLSVLHTTFGPGVRSQAQGEVVRRLINTSIRTVVLTSAAKQSIERLVGTRCDSVVVVSHGVPEFAYESPPATWEFDGLREGGPFRLVTPGYFREDKGLEAVLHAICSLREAGLRISYRIVGEPQAQFERQVRYRARVEALVRSLHLTAEVGIDARYLSLDEQVAAIRESHAGIFAYQDASHASSGAMPLVMSLGRPVVCTPFEYATSRSEDTPGVFVATGFDTPSIAAAIQELMRLTKYEELSAVTYNATRPWLWRNIGRTYAALYEACAATKAA